MKMLITGLTILFVALKLTHYIDWSWWLVLSPMLVAIIIFIMIIIAPFIWLIIFKLRGK